MGEHNNGPLNINPEIPTAITNSTSGALISVLEGFANVIQESSMAKNNGIHSQ